MEKQLISQFTELWHPYRKPEETHVNQGLTPIEDYLADNPHIVRPDWVNSGL